MGLEEKIKQETWDEVRKIEKEMKEAIEGYPALWGDFIKGEFGTALKYDCTDVKYVETKDYKAAIFRFNRIFQYQFRHFLGRDRRVAFDGADNLIMYVSKENPSYTKRYSTKKVPMHELRTQGYMAQRGIVGESGTLDNYTIWESDVERFYGKLKENEPIFKARYLNVKKIGDNTVEISWYGKNGKEYETTKRMVDFDRIEKEYQLARKEKRALKSID